MGDFRKTQVTEEIAHLAAEFLERESNHRSLVTVTRADISPDFKNATIYLSVFPDEFEEQALHFAKRKRPDFRAFIKKRAKLKFLPFFEFAIDEGEKNRRKLDALDL